MTANTTTENGTKIMPCDCKHAYQDGKHGKGKRVHNLRPGFKARCTVCGKEK